MGNAPSTTPDPRAEMERLGYEIVYKPHAVMAAYNAFYNVAYDGEQIAPPAARRMEVPLNEVWLSELLAPFERYVLYHELNEIRYRAQGYGVEAAHERALEDDLVWEGDPTWEKLQCEINVTPPARVLSLPGFGTRCFERIQNHRPYLAMDELRAVPGIGAKRYARLCEEFWCLGEEHAVTPW